MNQGVREFGKLESTCVAVAEEARAFHQRQGGSVHISHSPGRQRTDPAERNELGAPGNSFEPVLPGRIGSG